MTILAAAPVDNLFKHKALMQCGNFFNQNNFLIIVHPPKMDITRIILSKIIFCKTHLCKLIPN